MNDAMKGVLLSMCKGLFANPAIDKRFFALAYATSEEYQCLVLAIDSDLLTTEFLDDLVDLTDSVIRLRRHLRLDTEGQINLHQNLTDQLIAREIDANG